MTPETLIRLLLLAGMACMLLALVFSRTRRLGLACYGAGLAVCAILFTVNWMLAKAPPFGNMYQVMSLMPLALAPLYLFVARVRGQGWLLGYVAATSLIALGGAMSMPFQANWTQMPALQSPWFVPHVASYMLSYALATVGTLLALVSLFRKHEEARFMEAARSMLRLAFPFMTFGLWSGALWADEVWGGYWAWDIKEVWSLVTWGLYLIHFHLGSIPDWRKHERPVLLTAYAALLITFLVVNLLPKITSMHSYAM